MPTVIRGPSVWLSNLSAEEAERDAKVAASQISAVQQSAIRGATEPLASDPSGAPSFTEAVQQVQPGGWFSVPSPVPQPAAPQVAPQVAPQAYFGEPPQAPMQAPTDLQQGSFAASLGSGVAQWMPQSLQHLFSPPQAPGTQPTPDTRPARDARIVGGGFAAAMPSAPTLPGTPGQAAPASVAGVQATLGPIAEGDPAKFFETARPYADQVERETGVPAALSLAIAANETGYGQRRYMAGENNFHGIQAQPGEAGAVPYRDWRPDGSGGQQFYEAAQRSFTSPLEGFRGFANFLIQNPRYGPALQRYRETKDAGQLAADIHRAGYAEDPQYTTKIQSIMRGIPVSTGVGEVVDTRGVGTRTPLPAEETPGAQRQARMAWGSYTPETLTPNQRDEGLAQGLSLEEALAICGPAAAVAFARANARNPTLREAKELAERMNLWDVNVGMHGPASQVELLRNMGVNARLTEGTDWQAVAREVQRGNPTIVDTPKHYFVVSDYYPETGEFEFGQSAGVLTAAKGKTRWRPEEIPDLGFGAPRATIFMGASSGP